jgi:hypothetical protein
MQHARSVQQELTLQHPEAQLAHLVRPARSVRLSVKHGAHRVPLEHTERLPEPQQMQLASNALLHYLLSQGKQPADGQWQN